MKGIRITLHDGKSVKVSAEAWDEIRFYRTVMGHIAELTLEENKSVGEILDEIWAFTEKYTEMERD